MTKVRLVLDAIPPRPNGPNVGKPPKICARWMIIDVSIYKSKLCDEAAEAERLARAWLDRQNDLRRSASAAPYEIATNP